jgi:hypothetical protein
MRSLLPLLAAALLAPTPAFAQYGGSRCVQVVAYTAPDLLRCQQSGTDYLGRPIWTCC